MSSSTRRAAPGGGEKRSLVDDAYAGLKSAIIDGVFAPGAQASEQEIAVRLGMSRTPVHEAVIRLQEDGLVRVLSRKGVLICALRPDDMREIYDVIVAIEPLAAELIAGFPEQRRTSVADLLAAHTADMARALDERDLAGWGRADAAFHEVLAESCGNRRVARIVQTVNDQWRRARTATLRLRRDLTRSVAQHKRIVDAIRAGDAAGAHAEARSHRIAARDEILPLLESAGLKHL